MTKEITVVLFKIRLIVMLSLFYRKKVPFATAEVEFQIYYMIYLVHVNKLFLN